MQALKDERRERFCQLVALEGYDTSEAAFRAGYGRDKHPTRDNYHNLVANRLMSREDVTLRINTIRMLYDKNDSTYKDTLVKRLKNILDFNPLKYYKSNNVTLDKGKILTDVYLAKQVQDWDLEDARLVNGFDSRGMPKFIDKQWAFEKLIKIYQLEGSVAAEVEDIVKLFKEANLPTGECYVEPASLNIGETDEVSLQLERELEAEIGE